MLDEILLYDLNDSPFCLKARICLQLKNVPFRRVTVTVGRLRELGRLNPLAQVPVLMHHGEVIADAGRIARFLERQYPEPAIIPADPAARAYAALLEEWADEALSFAIGGCAWLNPDNDAAARANTVDEMTGTLLRPLVGWRIVRRFRARYAARGYGAATHGELVDRLRDHLEVLETLLEGKPYLLGRRSTLADVAVFAQLTWMQRYAEARLLREAPGVTAWLARVGAEPAIAAALSS